MKNKNDFKIIMRIAFKTLMTHIFQCCVFCKNTYNPHGGNLNKHMTMDHTNTFSGISRSMSGQEVCQEKIIEKTFNPKGPSLNKSFVQETKSRREPKLENDISKLTFGKLFGKTFFCYIRVDIKIF